MRSIILIGVGLAWLAVLSIAQSAEVVGIGDIAKIARSPETLNEVYLLRSGRDALARRQQLVDDSRRYLWITVPFWSKDESGLDLINRLQSKPASSGNLSILQDWVAPYYSDGEKFLKSQLRPYVHYWNSPTWQRNFSFQIKRGHIHDKFFISDDRVILGGRNVGDGYFTPSRATPGFFDLDVEIRGPAARLAAQNHLKLITLAEYMASPAHFPPFEKQEIQAAQSYFYENQEDHDFYTVASNPPRRELNRVHIPIRAKLADPLLFPPLVARAEETVPVTLLHDNPLFDRDPETGKRFSKTLLAIQKLTASSKELRITTPYATFDADMIAWLKTAAAGGLAITIVTNSFESNDMGKASYKGAASHYPELIRTGIRIGEWQGHRHLKAIEDEQKCVIPADQWPGNTLHAKLALFDDREFLIGSNNLNRQSLRRNSEVMAYIRDSKLAGEVAQVFADVEKPAAVDCGAQRFAAPAQVEWIDAKRASEIQTAFKITKPIYDYPLGN